MADRSNIVTLWFQDLPIDQKEEFIKYLLSQSGNACLVKLKQILKTKGQRLENSEFQPSVYASPNWAYYQAHNNGYRQALKLIDDLLAFVN